jgi:CPA2 family monovalent cation:H+ antiporter-2
LHAVHLKDSSWGANLLHIISIQDLIMIPLLALSEMGHGEVNEYMSTLARMFFILVFFKTSSVCAKFIIAGARNAEQKANSEGSGEIFTLSVVAYALTMATITEELHMSLEAGALFAGVILTNSPHIGLVLKSIRPITNVFGGMYLTSLGMIISPIFVSQRALEILFLVMTIGAIKLLIVSSIVKYMYLYSGEVSFALACTMAQISEGSLVVLAKAQRVGIVSRHTYLLLIPTTCILLCVSPFFSSLTLKALVTKKNSIDCYKSSIYNDYYGGDKSSKSGREGRMHAV